MDNRNQILEPGVIRVLMIDDDENDFFLTAHMLSRVEGHKYEFQWVPNYRQGLEAMLGASYDICLLDYRLGPDSGLELMKAAFQMGCRRPVIIMTGQGETAVDIKAIRCGAMDYMTKGQTGTGVLDRTIRHAIANWSVLEKLRAAQSECASLSLKLQEAEER